MIACMFPGQGSQFVGMGQELYHAFSCAKAVFQEVDDALEENLSHCIFQGPLEKLTLSQNAQPALLAVSIAVTRVLEHLMSAPLERFTRVVAGHSLGEYAALVASKALNLTDGARLLRLRGQAMGQAVAPQLGMMAAVLGLSFEQVVAITQQAAQHDVCCVANDNSAEQLVISGHKAAVERAMVLSKAQGARRCVVLNVSGPFHSPLMLPAEKMMAKPLEETTFYAPCIPFIPNVLGTVQNTLAPEQLNTYLKQQITSRVRWRETCAQMEHMGVRVYAELGAGTVLAGLAKRTFTHAKIFSLHNPQDLEVFVRTQQQEIN